MLCMVQLRLTAALCVQATLYATLAMQEAAFDLLCKVLFSLRVLRIGAKPYATFV